MRSLDLSRNPLGDDGVAALLGSRGFRCAFDRGEVAATAGTFLAPAALDRDARPATNWPAGAPPPPTHWTGTSIDHAYGRAADGVRALLPRGVFVALSELSDHLPVITDW